MKKNLGTLDRIVRTILGLGIIVWGVTTHNWLGAIGAVPLLTAIIGFYPAYCPLHLSTSGKGGDGCGGEK